eukprot:COSAG03_NODE_2870_length_2390_cov_1.941510_2_plen_99_part_00
MAALVHDWRRAEATLTEHCKLRHNPSIAFDQPERQLDRHCLPKCTQRDGSSLATLATPNADAELVQRAYSSAVQGCMIIMGVTRFHEASGVMKIREKN